MSPNFCPNCGQCLHLAHLRPRPPVTPYPGSWPYPRGYPWGPNYAKAINTKRDDAA